MTSALKKQEENAGCGKDHVPDGRAQTVRCPLASLAAVIPALNWVWVSVQAKNNQIFLGVWQGRIQILGPINNFTRAKGGHRLGMSSWGLLRCHCQWMAPLPWIFTITELECSDNQPRHLRYGSRWANTCLECSSLSHWKGHLPLLSGWVPEQPHCSWAASSLCLWAGFSQKPVLLVLF